MPELPEVETTANDLNKLIVGKTITDSWSGYDSKYYYGKPQIKDPKYFKNFKKEIIGKKVLSVTRKAKNVLINLSGNKTILVHMKMTGHLLFGEYKKTKNEWFPVSIKGPLVDPFNKWVRFVIKFKDGKHLALSDMRKFAKITLLDTDTILDSDDLKKLGPEIFDKGFTFKKFSERLNLKPKGNIKTVLMNQEVITGIGNIYSDEALWLTKLHPETLVSDISNEKMKDLFINSKKVLRKGIDFKGDSMQDYRRPSGEPGDFQNHHNVYQRRRKDCNRKGCKGVIERIVVGGRGTHYCPFCQTL